MGAAGGGEQLPSFFVPLCIFPLFLQKRLILRLELALGGQSLLAGERATERPRPQGFSLKKMGGGDEVDSVERAISKTLPKISELLLIGDDISMLRYEKTGNNNLQLALQHCCETS